MKRDFIIAEIKRTAAENGGAPSGRRRFEVETGIKESDWYGKHWATWGAALQEAGFRPNEKQEKLGDDVLLGPSGAASSCRCRRATTRAVQQHVRPDRWLACARGGR